MEEKGALKLVKTVNSKITSQILEQANSELPSSPSFGKITWTKAL